MRLGTHTWGGPLPLASVSVANWSTRIPRRAPESHIAWTESRGTLRPDFPSVEIYRHSPTNWGNYTSVYRGQEGGSVYIPRLFGYFNRDDTF